MNLAWGQFPWTVDNHHAAEQSQGLDLCQYFTARCPDLSCQQHLLPHHPEQYPAGSTMCIAGSFWRFLHLLWQVLEIQTLYCIYLLHQSQVRITDEHRASAVFVISVLVQTTGPQKTEH